MDPRGNHPSPPTQTRLRALVSAPRWVVDDTLAYRLVNASRFPLGHNGHQLPREVPGLLLDAYCLTMHPLMQSHLAITHAPAHDPRWSWSSIP